LPATPTCRRANIGALTVEEVFPLTDAQRFALYAPRSGQLAPFSACEVDIPNSVSLDELVRRWNALAGTCDVLRLRFVDADGEITAQRFDAEPPALRITRVRGRSASEQARYAVGLRQERLLASSAPLDGVDAFVVVPDEGPRYFGMRLHAAAIDGWGGYLLNAAATSWLAGRPHDLGAVSWAQHLRGNSEASAARSERNLDYWKQRLAPLQAAPVPRGPQVRVVDGRFATVRRSGSARAKIRAAAIRLATSEAALLAALFVELLRAHFPYERIVLNSVAANRHRSKDRAVIGRLALLVHIPIDTSGRTAADRVRGVARELLGAYAHGEYPYDRLRSWLSDDDPIIDPHRINFAFDFFPEGVVPINASDGATPHVGRVESTLVTSRTVALRVAASDADLECELIWDPATAPWSTGDGHHALVGLLRRALML